MTQMPLNESKKLYQEFTNEMGWEDLKQEDVSTIFTALFGYFREELEIKF